jgi:GT2 family glycosyltransferase
MERHGDIGILGFNLILPNGRSQQYSDKTRPWEVNEISFAAVMTRSRVFKRVGYLDSEYVVGYAEDTDFCYRTRRCGFRIVYVPQIKIFHIHQATFKRILHVTFMISARNGFRHFMLNKPLHEAFIWFIKAFIDVRDGRIVLRNDVRRLREFAYGLITYVKQQRFEGFLKLLVESLRRRLSLCY